jgi:hypothetical protein
MASHDGDCDVEWYKLSGIIKCKKCGKSVHDPEQKIIKQGIKAIMALLK